VKREEATHQWDLEEPWNFDKFCNGGLSGRFHLQSQFDLEFLFEKDYPNNQIEHYGTA